MRTNSLMVLLTTVAVACGPGEPRSTESAAAAPSLSGPYMGQAAPGAEPQVFAPGRVSTGLHTRDLTMTPQGDEIYFSVQAGPFAAILESRLVDGRWTRPEVASFSADPRTMEIEPHISPDGRKLFFVSNRLPDGGALPDSTLGRWDRADIWAMDRRPDGWSEPYRLPDVVNTEATEFFPSSTRDGTLYFTRRDADTGTESIYRARPNGSGSGYQEPEKLPAEVNSANQFNAFVAPDESYLILSIFGRDDSVGGTDYYVVFRDDDDNWSGPVNLGEVVNRPRGSEWSASVSPDGRYLFFMSTRAGWPETPPDALTREWLLDFHLGPESGNPSIYWMDASFIAELRELAGDDSSPAD